MVDASSERLGWGGGLSPCGGKYGWVTGIGMNNVILNTVRICGEGLENVELQRE